jgi:hypothetical protein
MLGMIFLSDNERAQLKAQHKRERDKRICDRIKAVLLCDKGWSVPAIAEALLLSEDAIREHIIEYRDSKKLKPESLSAMSGKKDAQRFRDDFCDEWSK